MTNTHTHTHHNAHRHPRGEASFWLFPIVHETNMTLMSNFSAFGVGWGYSAAQLGLPSSESSRVGVPLSVLEFLCASIPLAASPWTYDSLLALEERDTPVMTASQQQIALLIGICVCFVAGTLLARTQMGRQAIAVTNEYGHDRGDAECGFDMRPNDATVSTAPAPGKEALHD